VALITGNFESFLLSVYIFSLDAYMIALTNVSTEVAREVAIW
jgi:hypothetical protein